MPGDRAQPDGAVPAQDEHPLTIRARCADAIGGLGIALDHSRQVLSTTVIGVWPPAPHNRVAVIDDL